MPRGTTVVLGGATVELGGATPNQEGRRWRHLKQTRTVLVGWLVWLGAVLRVCPCVTYEFKSVSYHLIAKNQTQNLT